MLNNFIYAETKELFLEQLEAGNILDEAIVFIADTGKIWNHGTYFGGEGSGLDTDVITELQTAVSQLQSNKLDSSTAESTYAKISDLPSLDGYLTETTANSLYATISQYNTLNQTVGNIQTELSNKLTSADLEGYAKTEDVPTKLSDLTDDSDFITNTEATAAYAPKSLVETVDNQATTISTLATKTELSTGLAGKLDNSAASGFVPTTRKVNGVALDEDITITATDPNAATKTELNDVNTDLQTFKSNVATIYATDQDVANAVSALVDSSPDTLNTLNELAAALGDDPNFATTVATQIGTKADQSALNATNTNLANVDAKFDNYLPKTGGTMSGPITYDTTSSSNRSTNYISTGGGFGVNSGKYGLKLLAIEQSDCQMGLGVDLFGSTYELSIATTKNGNAGRISFGYHTVDSTEYTRVASIDCDGDFSINKINGYTPITSDNIGSQSVSYAASAGSVAWGNVTGKPSFATVATSGSYNDLSNKPTIPSVGNGTVTIKQNGTTKGTFTMNQSGNTTVELTDTNTDTNTHYTTRIYAGASGTTTNAAATDPYLKVTDDNTYRNQIQFKGGGATSISSDANGVITISSTDTNTNTWRGITDSVSTTDSTISGSATAVKTAYDKAVSAYNLANGKTSNTGTVTSVATGVGLTGGTITGSGTIKCKLKSETAATYNSNNITNTSGRQYAVVADKSGYLSVNVPWTDTDTNTTYSAGTGISLSGTTFSHADTNTNISADTSYGPTANVTQSAKNTASFKVPQITLDQFGHVKSVTERTITVTDTDTNTDTDTHWTTRLYAGASRTAANAAATNPYLKVTDNNTYRNQVRFLGAGAATVTSDASGNITITSTNTTYSAGSGLSLSGTAFSHGATSALLPGSYGPTANVTGSNGATIVVPQITVDNYGHVTGVTNRTYTSVDADTKNTAGATNSTSKLYLIGATDQVSTSITYSNSGVYATSGSVYASSFYETSDERLKNFGEDIDVDFEKLKTIPKKYFTWKDDETTNLQIGTSAQAVQEIYPEIVSEDNKLHVDYAKLSVVALAAIDKLYAENCELKDRLEKLENFIKC